MWLLVFTDCRRCNTPLTVQPPSSFLPLLVAYELWLLPRVASFSIRYISASCDSDLLCLFGCFLLGCLPGSSARLGGRRTRQNGEPIHRMKSLLFINRNIALKFLCMMTGRLYKDSNQVLLFIKRRAHAGHRRSPTPLPRMNSSFLP
jgi:hypothetical protein